MPFDSITNEQIAELIGSSGYNFGNLNDQFILFPGVEADGYIIESHGKVIKTNKNLIITGPIPPGYSGSIYRLISTDINTTEFFTRELKRFFNDEGEMKEEMIPDGIVSG